ncbi:MAG: thioredoxin domain-containing protein [Planctomycetota bacterium]|jgi:uncharacterized protein YyaL (SSP411 family)
MKGIVLFAALNLLILSVAACGRKESPAMGENRLAGEKSPYLLQHAKNPVHWYPWGKEAFERARKEDKPIFLSIGYSTCHWCHVMAHESFEDPEVARLMNEAFVNIKVDREERPDIDGIYMKFCLMMTGSGGWPLTIVMTPDKKAFFAGTYFPKRSVPGRIGMMDLVPRLRDLWRTRKEEICASAEEVLSVAKRSADFTPGEGLAVSDLKRATRQLAARFDEKRGGFGTAPKFPSPHHLLFLLRYWKRTGDSQALHMVERTLQAMGRGGIWDHVGFGFHRYATDADWRVPHFEKMLYDQAGLAMAYTEAFQATQKPAYARTAKEILTYVLRDLKSPEGGFYSAEDADSEGEEGKFYLWKRDEIVALLGKEEGEWVSKALSVREDGNFAEEATGRKTGANILFLSPSPSDAEREAGGMDLPFEERLEAARRRLYEARERRVHPFKDTKILTDWNGLMIAALAKASQAFGKEEYAKAARDAATFILQTLRGPDGRLLHRYRDGEAGLPAHVDDYAFLIWGLIELAEATFETPFLGRRGGGLLLHRRRRGGAPSPGQGGLRRRRPFRQFRRPLESHAPGQADRKRGPPREGGGPGTGVFHPRPQGSHGIYAVSYRRGFRPRPHLRGRHRRLPESGGHPRHGEGPAAWIPSPKSRSASVGRGGGAGVPCALYETSDSRGRPGDRLCLPGLPVHPAHHRYRGDAGAARGKVGGAARVAGRRPPSQKTRIVFGSSAGGPHTKPPHKPYQNVGGGFEIPTSNIQIPTKSQISTLNNR